MNDYTFASPHVEVSWDRITNKAFQRIPREFITGKKDPVYEKGLLMKIMEHFGYDYSVLRERYQANYIDRQDYWIPMKLRKAKKKEVCEMFVDHINAEVASKAWAKLSVAGYATHTTSKLNEEAQPQENEIMNSSYFSKKVMIGSHEASAMSAKDIVDVLRQAEGEIKQLRKIKAKSKHIKKHIRSIEGDIKKLVKYLDSK